MVHAFHDRQLAEHGGPAGVRDEPALDSALTYPRNLTAYKQSDAAALAAAYAYRIVRNHPFVDGNKRTGWVVGRVSPARNGYSLKFDPHDAVQTIKKLASGKLSEPRLADWFRQRTVKS